MLFPTYPPESFQNSCQNPVQIHLKIYQKSFPNQAKINNNRKTLVKIKQKSTKIRIGTTRVKLYGCGPGEPAEPGELGSLRYAEFIVGTHYESDQNISNLRSL